MTAPALPPTQIVDSGEIIWGISLQPEGCPICKHVFLTDSTLIGSMCPACGQASLAPQPAEMRSEPPESFIPFQKKQSDLLPILASFVNPIWLRPDDFDAYTMARRLVPVYWPMWLVDSNLSGNWQAELGFDYQVQSSQASYKNGGWQSQNVVETRVRWEPRMGLLERHYDNVATPATDDHQKWITLVGNYHIDQAVPYQPDKVKGALFNIPDLRPDTAWISAQSSFVRNAANECVQACAAQHIRNFSIHPCFDKLNWSQLLMPVFFTYYTDDLGNRHPVLINGQTGAIGGVRLASQKKGWERAGISAGIAVVMMLAAVLCFVLTVVLPPLSILGFILAIVAFISGIYAIVPAVWPWQWNRKQQDHKVVTN